jgi:hypothetical protein
VATKNAEFTTEELAADAQATIKFWQNSNLSPEQCYGIILLLKETWERSYNISNVQIDEEPLQ